MRGLTAIGIVVLLASSELTWIRGPISGGVHSSIGIEWMAAGIGILAGLAWWLRSYRFLIFNGIAGLCLCSFSVCYLSLLDPTLWTLVDENMQSANIIIFSLRYSPGNFGIDPSFQASLPVETIIERLKAALYFINWGWNLCLAGSLLLLTPIYALQRPQIVRWIVVPFILLFSAQGLFLVDGFVSEYWRIKAEQDMVLGRYEQAIAKYEWAQKWNRQLAQSERAHYRLGEAYFYMGLPSHPNARFYLSDLDAQARTFKAATAGYLSALQEASTPLREVVEKRLAWAYVNSGMSLLRRGGVGPAIGEWERALSYDPNQVQILYFLSRAYFDQARYEQSIAMSHLLLAHSQNRILNANVQANIGDSYWQLKDHVKARLAYQASMRLDSHGNFRGYKSLGGT
jgi:tetratricopeptide (TPR) repeat protein